MTALLKNTPLSSESLTKIGSKRAFRIKLHYSLNTSRADTTSPNSSLLSDYPGSRTFSSPWVRMFSRLLDCRGSERTHI
jgi:hypothetical protein